MKSNDIRKSITFAHNHNCLIGTIIFKVHHIILTSPRNTLATILKAFWFFLLFMFFAYIYIYNFFSFEHIMHGYIGERKEIPNYVSQTSCFCYASATLHGFYEWHTDVLWLTSFSGEMVIYASLLGFVSPSHQKKW